MLVCVFLHRVWSQPPDSAVFGHLSIMGVHGGQEIHETGMQTYWPDRQENAENCNNCWSKCLQGEQNEQYLHVKQH